MSTVFRLQVPETTGGGGNQRDFLCCRMRTQLEGAQPLLATYCFLSHTKVMVVQNGQAGMVWGGGNMCGGYMCCRHRLLRQPKMAFCAWYGAKGSGIEIVHNDRSDSPLLSCSASLGRLHVRYSRSEYRWMFGIPLDPEREGTMQPLDPPSPGRNQDEILGPRREYQPRR